MAEPTERMMNGIFNSEDARRGYALNKMCYSFNNAESRAAFLADPDAYCDKYGLNEDQKEAIKSRDKGKFLAAGGSLYFLAKFVRVKPPSETSDH